MVVSAGYDDVTRTLIYSGRPLSVRKTPYVAEWFANIFVFPCTIIRLRYRETARKSEQETLVADGKVPHEVELEVKPNRSIEGMACTFLAPIRVLWLKDSSPHGQGRGEH